MNDIYRINTNNHLISIDILKCIATLLIINHRLQISYGDYKIFATGGAIGVSIFFFCSGYCLAHSNAKSLFQWMQKRIGRLYPAIWISMFLIMMKGENVSWASFLISSNYWFIQALIIFYILLYPLTRYLPNHIGKIILIVSLIYICIYMHIPHTKESLLGETYLKWLLFFIIFLIGVLIRNKNTMNNGKLIVNISIAIIMYGMFYGIWLCFSLLKNFSATLLSIPFLFLGTIILFYAFSSNTINKILFNCKKLNFLINFLSAITLEVYLIQRVFTDKFEDIIYFLFPINIPIIFIFVLMQAYILHVLSKIISSSFAGTSISFKDSLKI